MDDSSEKDKDYFLYFLNNHAKKFPNIFILGDLFDWWPGDDTYQFKKIISGLKKLSKKSKLFLVIFQSKNLGFYKTYHLLANL